MCVFCGERNLVSRRFPLGRQKSRRYVLCLSCGGISCAAEDLPGRDRERERYLLHNNRPEDSGYREMLGAFAERVRAVCRHCGILDWPAAAGGVSASGFPVLDFGCGPVPVLAALLREQGWAASGLDPLFFPDGWPEKTADGSRFSVVLCHESAEHFHAPRRTFARISAFLQPGGVCAVSTRFLPDFPVPAAGASGADFPAFFSQWWYRMDFTHVSFYTRKAMVRTASFSGLQAVFPDPAENCSRIPFLLFQKGADGA